MTAQPSKPSRWALAALIAVSGLIGATACSSAQDGAGPGNPSSTKSTQPTPWQQTLNKVKADGSVDASTALTAFALAIGPVPGVTPPSGDRKDITSGTVAIRWVTRVWSKLSTAQKQAVQDALAGTAAPGSGTHSIRAVAAPPKPVPLPLDPNGPNVPCVAGDSTDASAYRTLVDDAVAKIAGQLHRQLKLPIQIAVDTKKPKDDDGAYMYTYACSGKKIANGKGQGCTLHITPEANLYPSNSPDTSTALTHEVMHCFVLDRIGNAKEANLPDWFGEGMPNWVGSVFGQTGDVIGSSWRAYLNNATRPLSSRTYDGIGFFVHLAETGVNPWAVIDKMTDAMANGAGTAAGWNAAGVSTAFLDSWGSGFVQGAGGMTGRAWSTSGPGLPSYRPNLDTAPGGEVVDGKSLTIDVPQEATFPVTASIGAEVVLVKPSGGIGRISLGHGTDATLDVAAGKTYCTLGADQCKCPEGSGGEGTTFTPIEKGLQYVGVTGGLKKASLNIAGQSLEEFCKAKKSPLVGTWRAVSTKIAVDPPGLSYRTTGGAGYTLTVAANGRMTINYAGITPPSYTVVFTDSGLTNHAKVMVSGTDTGTLDLKRAGVWAPTSVHPGIKETADFGGGANMAGAGMFGGPLLGGTWAIAGKTLTVHRSARASSATWVYTKVK
jgi:hypothetical protein